jgi:hypothetical protein
VIKTLTRYDTTEDTWSRPQSPIPLQAINIVFAFCAITMFMLLAFWTIVFVNQS